jgi:hypothetical protein
MIHSLKRKSAHPAAQAWRASRILEVQLKSCAELYEADAEQIDRCNTVNQYGNE